MVEFFRVSLVLKAYHRLNCFGNWIVFSKFPGGEVVTGFLRQFDDKLLRRPFLMRQIFWR